MLQNVHRKLVYRECRRMTMEAMKVALRWYRDTGDEEFLERAKELGESSQWYKEEIQKLSTG